MTHYAEKKYFLRTFVWIELLTVALAQTPLTAQLSETDLGSLNSQASAFFTEANNLIKTNALQAYELYDKSILRYQKIIDEGHIENVYLYYNIANAYLMKHDLGNAILNYRRGEILDPTYTDLIKNLNYARLQRKDNIPVTTEKKILQTLFFWHYDLSRKVKFLLVTSTWIVLCLLFTISLYKRKTRFLRLLCLLLAITIVSFSISLTIDLLGHRNNIEGVILTDSVIVRQGDGRNYPPSFEQPLHSGTEFKVIDQRPDWLHIKLANSNDTWIHRSHTGLID